MKRNPNSLFFLTFTFSSQCIPTKSFIFPSPFLIVVAVLLPKKPYSFFPSPFYFEVTVSSLRRLFYFEVVGKPVLESYKVFTKDKEEARCFVTREFRPKAYEYKSQAPEVVISPWYAPIFTAIWKCPAPSKVSGFVWQLLHGQIPTRNNLVIRRILEASGDVSCALCAQGQIGETSLNEASSR